MCILCVIACIDGDIRLSGGRNGSEGRVEICNGNAWGTVCDDLWGNIDAQVVCNQLGFASTGKLCRLYGRGTHALHDCPNKYNTSSKKETLGTYLTISCGQL